MSKLDESTRRELFKAYQKMCELYEIVHSTVTCIGGPKADQAKAYWLGSLDLGLRGERYVGGNDTFKDYLYSLDIIDEDEEYIEAEDEGDEGDEAEDEGCPECGSDDYVYDMDNERKEPGEALEYDCNDCGAHFSIYSL